MAFLLMSPYSVTAFGQDAAGRERAELLRQLERTTFRPIDAAVKGRAAERLKAAVQALQRARGERDRDQLEWLGIPESPEADLSAMLDDLATLRQIQFQLEQDFEPFEQDVYQELRAAIEHYGRVVLAQTVEELQGRFEQRREGIRAVLEGLNGAPDAAEHERLARHVVWLEQHLQAEELVSKLREAFSHPNVVLHMPRASLILVSEQTVRESEPVRQQSGPVRSSGTSRLEGTVRLLPQEGGAPLRLAFPAGVELATANRLGPYGFASRATTRLDGRLNLELTREGLRAASDPAVSARTCLWNGPARLQSPHGSSRIGGRVVDRLIARQAAEAASQISATVSRRIREEFARLADEQLQEINGQFQQILLDRAIRMQMQPRRWQVSGSDDALTLRLTVDQHSGLAAPATRPLANPRQAPAVSMHETFAGDLANAAFRAQNFPTELDANTLQSFNDQLPVQVFERRDFLPDPRLRIVLHPRRPLRLRFARRRIELEFVSSRMELEGDVLENARLTLAFRLQPNGTMLVVTREGDANISVASPASEEGDAQRVAKFQQAVREELLAALKGEVELPSVVETEDWNLRPERILADAGWLTVVGQFGVTPEDTE